MTPEEFREWLYVYKTKGSSRWWWNRAEGDKAEAKIYPMLTVDEAYDIRHKRQHGLTLDEWTHFHELCEQLDAKYGPPPPPPKPSPWSPTNSRQHLAQDVSVQNVEPVITTTLEAKVDLLLERVDYIISKMSAAEAASGADTKVD